MLCLQMKLQVEEVEICHEEQSSITRVLYLA